MQGEGKSQVLEGDSKTWKLVTVHENRHRGMAPEFCIRFLQVVYLQNILSICLHFHQLFVYIFFQSPMYHVLIIVVTLTNAWVTASITFRHTVDQKPRAFFFQIQKKFEIGFTIFYDIEVLFKIFCFGVSGYMSRSMHKFELLSAVMTTIHVLPIKGLFLSWISIFQVSKIFI